MFSPNSEEYLIDEKPLSELRVVDLKNHLEKRGLSKSGSKNVLVKRLRDSLALEKNKLEQSTKDPNSAPNMEMKSCGSNIVAEYLEKQQQALQAAKKAAQAARAAAHDDSGSATEDVAENDHDRTIDSQKDEFPMDSHKEEPETTTDEPKEVVIDEKNEQTPRLEENFDQEKVENADESVGKMDQNAKKADVTEEEEKEIRSTAERTVEEDDVTQNDDKDTRGTEDDDSSSRSTSDVSYNGHDETMDSQKDVSQIEEDEKPEQERREDEVTDETGNKEIAENVEPIVVEEEDQVVEKAADVVEEEDQGNGTQLITTDYVIDDRDFITTAETLKTEKPQRKRKWGSTTVGKRNTVSISSDSLKEIVGNVKAPETIIASTLDEPVQLDYDEDPAPKRIVISREDMDEDETTVEAAPDNAEQLPKKEKQEKTKLILEPLTYDEGFIRERSPSPARHPVSRIIHVRCLTRPFTVKAFQEFVGKFGTFCKEEFWIDNIKSHCFIKYDKEEDAKEAREKLDNIRWPLSNPNVLHVDFANQDDLDRHVNKTSKENDRQPRNSFQAENKVDLHKPREVTIREISTNKVDNTKKSERNRSPKVNDESKLWSKSREWDKGKESWRNGKSPPRREERRKSRSPSHKRNDVKQQDVAPVKLLEDLFRKTKGTPCLYWLPLSLEQINEKEKQRARREMERSERLKQMAKFDEKEKERRRANEREREKGKSSRDHRRPEDASSRPPHRRRLGNPMDWI